MSFGYGGFARLALATGIVVLGGVCLKGSGSADLPSAIQYAHIYRQSAPEEQEPILPSLQGLPAGLDAPVAYVTAARWEKSPVTYAIVNCPSKIECGIAHQAVRDSVEVWDSVSGITLDEAQAGADIVIQWSAADIPVSGPGRRIDGPGGILGFSFFPVSWLEDYAGDVYLDDAEYWVVVQPTMAQDIHLPTVALHEIGHSLGLDHSGDPNALMWADYVGPRGLTADDIAGIQALYGPGEATLTPAVPEQAPVGAVTLQSTTTLRIRSGPGTQFSQIDQLPPGISVPVLGRNELGDWLFIQHNSIRGWVAGWLSTVSGDLGTVPVIGLTPAPPAQPDPDLEPPVPAPGAITTTANTNVVIRSGPATGFGQIGLLPNGATASVLGRNSSGFWLLIDYNGVRGWAAAWLMTINGDLSQVPELG